MTRVAVLLSGCGYLDGAEIRESVLALLALDQEDAEVTMFAPNEAQHHVVNHLTNQPTKESRNILVEAARIARGDIHDISTCQEKNFDALIIPGGFGVAKNYSNLAFASGKPSIHPEFKRIVSAFVAMKKPVGAICISPAVLVAALAPTHSPTVTIGDDENNLIASLGGKHQHCDADEIAIDPVLHIVSCSAYMRDQDRLKDIAEGIRKLVHEVIARAHHS